MSRGLLGPTPEPEPRPRHGVSEWASGLARLGGSEPEPDQWTKNVLGGTHSDPLLLLFILCPMMNDDYVIPERMKIDSFGLLDHYTRDQEKHETISKGLLNI